ncbi:MAG: hypothetical protein HY079_15050, partial [Elusimicrobia bacterium]|nr:hypothetical protein [Elusimicrobiota bacterium]
MTMPSLRAPSKALAAALSAAVVVGAPGPLALSAAAQAVNLGAVRPVAGAPAAAAGAAAVGVNAAPMLSPTLAAPSLSVASALSAAPAACIFAPKAAAPASAQSPAPAPSPRFQVGPVHRVAMKAMAATWKVWDRAIDSRWDKMPKMLG